MNEEVTRVEEVMLAIRETNALGIADPVKASLVADLQHIADRLIWYEEKAANCIVTNQTQADAAAIVCETIANDVKAVKGQEVLSKITEGLHKLHRQWTAIRGRFIDPMEASRKTIKQTINKWETAEAEKAQAEQIRLQAEADARARKEREALEAKAAKMKTEEKRQQYLDQAASVAAPTVTIEAPKSSVKFSTRWKVKAVNTTTFIQAAAQNTMMHGFIEIKTTALERSKAANPSLEVPGITFEKVRV